MQDDPNHKTYGKACPQRILKVTDGADLIDTFALKRSGKKTPRVYLCCITPGWRIGFVRTAGSRITKVGAGVSWNEPMMVNGINYQVKVNMIWGTDPGKISDSSEANVRFFVSCRGDESQLTLIGRFEMLAWRWLKVDPDTHNAQCDLIMHRFIGNRDEFQRSLLNKMLPDFSYEKPYKSGNATDFFGNVGEFRLWVKRWDEVDDPRLGLPVIIAERLLHV